MKRRVLIIDDNEQDRKAMLIALKKDGYHDIALAETGDQGIETAKTFKPEVVVIDVVLTTLDDGLDVCRKIKAIEGLETSVIIITGHLEAINAAKARTSGASEIIQKTEGFKNISQTIENLT